MRKLTGKLASCGVVLGLVLTAGCPSTQPQRLPDNGSDPLLGPDAPSLPAKGGAVPPTGPEAKLKAPLPLTQQTSSVAELAGGPLKGGRDTIAIPVTDTAGNRAWQSKEPGKTVLNPPLPVAEGQGLKPVPEFATGGIPKALQAELDKRYVVNVKQQTIPGGVRVSCLVADPNATVIREIEADRSTLEEAVRAILAKIDQPR